jgi:hypothetical protein
VAYRAANCLTLLEPPLINMKAVLELSVGLTLALSCHLDSASLVLSAKDCIALALSATPTISSAYISAVLSASYSSEMQIPGTARHVYTYFSHKESWASVQVASCRAQYAT